MQFILEVLRQDFGSTFSLTSSMEEFVNIDEDIEMEGILTDEEILKQARSKNDEGEDETNESLNHNQYHYLKQLLVSL